MRINIVGCNGGSSVHTKNTTYLVNDCLAIDAGSITQGLTLEEQCKIDAVLISHPHLDHIGGLPFLIDNCLSHRKTPLKIMGSINVLQALRMHIFNNVIWPDFTKIPSLHNPSIEFIELQANLPLKFNNLVIIPVKVNHVPGSLGFIINDSETSIIFTQDTAATDEIWNIARKQKNIKAIFTEVSLPNEEFELARISKHMTPDCLSHEITKMPFGTPVYLGHLKPSVFDTVLEQIKKLQNQLSGKRPIYLLSDNDVIIV